MNLTLSIDERVVLEARKRAGVLGKSLNQLVREYLERLSGLSNPQRDIEELRELSDPPKGDARGWRFNRDELHERS